ncbi:hypothetical protein FRC0474_02014 [Corynebacterium diphtheriae]|nr:hypothetical protein FRC0026_01774 [Corynebacterium diphtheriae]CAB0810617.1 hypothetical protein FRC0201_01787 [Corynebacterium diphtheriae]CAB0970743.1 hypothetical protein FRC0474_02014 [Corynebacterium diphtheriae]
MPRSTEHYGLPYPLGSDTIRSLPGILQQLSTRIAAVLGEIEEKSQKDLEYIKREVKDLKDNYPGISQTLANLNYLYGSKVRPMLEAWEKAGKPQDFGKSQGTTPTQLIEQLKNIDSRLEKLEASGQWGNPQNVTPATVIAWLKNSDSQRDSIDKRLVKAENKIRNLERRL